MVYENILSGAFIYSMGAIAAKRVGPDEVLKNSINFFQQTPSDKKVGDLLADWGNKSFIIEFKSAIGQIDRELEKEHKNALINKLGTSKGLLDLSKKCHFLGYGKYEQVGAETSIDYVFQSYVEVLTKSTNKKEYNLNSFITRLLDEEGLGISSRQEFTDYIDFLEQQFAGTSSGASGGRQKPISGIVSTISSNGSVVFIEYKNYEHLKYLMSQQIAIEQYLSQQIAYEHSLKHQHVVSRSQEQNRRNGISM